MAGLQKLTDFILFQKFSLDRLDLLFSLFVSISVDVCNKELFFLFVFKMTPLSYSLYITGHF